MHVIYIFCKPSFSLPRLPKSYFVHCLPHSPCLFVCSLVFCNLTCMLSSTAHLCDLACCYCCSNSSSALTVHPRGLITHGIFNSSGGITYHSIAQSLTKTIDSTRSAPIINQRTKLLQRISPPRNDHRPSLHHLIRKPQKPHLFHPETYRLSSQTTHQRFPKMYLNELPPRTMCLCGRRLRHRLHHQSGVSQGP